MTSQIDQTGSFVGLEKPDVRRSRELDGLHVGLGRPAQVEMGGKHVDLCLGGAGGSRSRRPVRPSDWRRIRLV